ncbi:MAG: hypothetical protein HZA50_16475 [Planctomycetes bacterium]|nr:hypothetical protein [Planctomycetota bacterium]
MSKTTGIHPLIMGLLCLAGLSAGCGAAASHFTTPDRRSNGLVVILPGIEGESGFNHDIRRGLAAAGIYRSLPIYSWGRPIPVLGMLLNQMDPLGNWLAGKGLADYIVRYQDENPGKPVYIIGHSGGGGIAVFAAAQMPDDRQIDGLMLLHASISAGYDLTRALHHCKKGIVNFYNTDDVGLLGIGTIIVGSVDGGHGPAAGLIGFDEPDSSDKEDKKLAYAKLYQVPLTRQFFISDSGSHSMATKPLFVARYVAEWMLCQIWPPPPIKMTVE